MLHGTESEEEEGKSLALIKSLLFILMIIFFDLTNSLASYSIPDHAHLSST